MALAMSGFSPKGHPHLATESDLDGGSVQSDTRRGEYGEGRKLVATEEVGAQARWQIRPIPPRTNYAVEPALGRVSLRKMRIGVHLQHRNRATSPIDYSGN